MKPWRTPKRPNPKSPHVCRIRTAWTKTRKVLMPLQYVELQFHTTTNKAYTHVQIYGATQFYIHVHCSSVLKEFWPQTKKKNTKKQHMGVSKNRGGPPKSSISIGVFHDFHHPFWGTSIFGSSNQPRFAGESSIRVSRRIKVSKTCRVEMVDMGAAMIHREPFKRCILGLIIKGTIWRVPFSR